MSTALIMGLALQLGCYSIKGIVLIFKGHTVHSSLSPSDGSNPV